MDASHGAIRRCVARERGQSLAELALLVPVLLIFALGAIDLGRVYTTDVQVRAAAQKGVQYGSTSATNASDAAAIQTAAVDGVKLSASPTVTSSVFADNSGGQAVQVTVQTSFHTLIAWPGLPHTSTIRHSSVAKVLQ